MSRYPYIDRNPYIVAAGKPSGNVYETAKSAFEDVKLQDKVDALKRELGLLDTKAMYQETVRGPDLDTSGAFTEIRHCLRKPMPSEFESIDEEVKCTIYDSYWNKPVGKSRDQTPGLPTGMKPREVTFGIQTKSSEPGSWAINPPKPAELVQKEDDDFHDLYAFTHQNYHPGEQVRRGYSPPFSHYTRFGGKKRLVHGGGELIKRCLTWFNNDPISNVSRRLAAVRNRTLPPLGKSLDRTGVTDTVPPNHTYGAPSPSSFYGVDDLLNECPPSLVRRDMLTFLSYANSLRQSIAKKISQNVIDLEELFDEISSLYKDDKSDVQDCCVHLDCIERIMRRYQVFLDRAKLEPLLRMLGLLTDDFQIQVKDFINFIDKNSSFPDLKKEYYILPPEYLNCPEKTSEPEHPPVDYSLPAAGEPTVRLNAPRPYYQGSIVNMDHLGQETTARALVSPSIFTQYGLSHRDFFKPRSKEMLGKLFKKIDVTLTDEELDEIYKEGYELDKTGGVCVETFRNILDERAYKAYNKLKQ